MKYHVEISEQAERDMHEIFQYISFTSLQPLIAENVIDHIEEAIFSLDFMPMRYPKYPSKRWANLRCMTIDNHNVFYQANQELKEVFVVQIIYGRRNIPKILGE